VAIAAPGDRNRAKARLIGPSSDPERRERPISWRRYRPQESHIKSQRGTITTRDGRSLIQAVKKMCLDTTGSDVRWASICEICGSLNASSGSKLTAHCASICGRVTLTDLADAACLSYHFSHSFKQGVGICPQRFVRRRRPERTKTLMRRTNQSLAAIAQRVGFADQSHLRSQSQHRRCAVIFRG